MNSTSSAHPLLKVFIACSPKDEHHKNELIKQMNLLKQEGLIQHLQDQDIEAGLERDDTIKKYLETADVILLLLSPDFNDSDFYHNRVKPAVRQRHKLKTARVCVISILLRPCDWKNDGSDKLIVLPEDKRFVTLLSNRDEAFLNIVESIRRIIEPLQLKKHEIFFRRTGRNLRIFFSCLLHIGGGIFLSFAFAILLMGLINKAGDVIIMGVFFGVLSAPLFWLKNKFFK